MKKPGYLPGFFMLVVALFNQTEHISQQELDTADE